MPVGQKCRKKKKGLLIFCLSIIKTPHLKKILRIKIKHKIKTNNSLSWITTEEEKWDCALQVKCWPPTQVCKCTFAVYLKHTLRTREFFTNRNPHCHLPTVPCCYKMCMHALLCRHPINNLCRASETQAIASSWSDIYSYGPGSFQSEFQSPFFLMLFTTSLL